MFGVSTIRATASAALLLAIAPAFADTVKFKADLKGASEVPATDSKGTGAVDASYDTATKASILLDAAPRWLASLQQLHC